MSRDAQNAGDCWTRRAELVRRAQGGDRDAYRAFLEEIRPALAALLRRWSADADDLDDLCQEVLLTVHRARHTYDPARPLRPWLFAIARNVAADHARRRLKRLSRELAVETLPEVAAEEAEASHAELAEVLSRLPPPQREAFELLKIAGLSVEESARRAGTTTGALKVRASRAYRAIKRMLAT
jgi:RNA polymerase sigma-70 factor (ECF subfamily)